MRLRVAPGGRAENLFDNLDIDKQDALDKFLRGRGDCGSALRPRFPNHNTLFAIPDRAAKSGVDRHEIARADVPVRVEACDRCPSSPPDESVRLADRTGS